MEGKSRRPAKRELEILYLDQGTSPDKIGGIYGVGRSTVYNWLSEYGIQRRTLSEAAKLRMSKDPGYKISPPMEKSLVEKSAENLGIPEDEAYLLLRGEGEEIQPYQRRPSREFLDGIYNRRRRSTTQIGELFDVTPSTVRNWIIYYGFRLRTASEAQLITGSKPSKSDLEDLFLNQKKSPRQIAKLCHVSRSAVARWLKQDGIPGRNRKEAARVKALSGIMDNEEIE